MSMDIQELTPEQEAVNTTTEAQPTETESTESVQQETPTEEVREQNNWKNGERRINRRQSLKARVRELEERLAQYEGKDDDFSKFQRQQLQDRLDDMQAIEADDTANDFANRAAPFFGEETSQFMENVYRYGAYVNANEPGLLKYMNREYGPILLHEWMQRMDNPSLREQWLAFTNFEKERILDKFYGQITQIVKQSTAPKAQPRPNVPVPNGGREAPAQSPTDDFGIELGKALARHKG